MKINDIKNNLDLVSDKVYQIDDWYDLEDSDIQNEFLNGNYDYLFLCDTGELYKLIQ